MPYRSPYAGRLSDLIMRQGDIAADRAARSGEMWGNVIRGVAGIPAGMQQWRAANAEAQERAYDRQIARANVASQIGEREAAINERGYKRMDEQATKDLALTTQKVSAWLGDIASAPDAESQKMAYTTGRDALVKEGRLTPQDAPEFFPGQSWVKSRMAMLLPAAERFKQMFPESELLVEVGPGAILTPRSQAAGQPAYKAPQAPEPLHPVGPKGILTPRSQAAGQPAFRPPQREPQGSYQWAKDPKTGAVRLMSADEIRAIGAGQPDTADMRNKEAGKKTAAIAVKAVRDLGAGIFTKVGPAQRIDAIKRGAEAIWGTDPEFRTYQDSRMALAGTLAVEQQGSRVSDADVKALWLPMVPDAYRDTKESYDLKWKLIDSMRGFEGAGEFDFDPATGQFVPHGAR